MNKTMGSPPEAKEDAPPPRKLSRQARRTQLIEATIETVPSHEAGFEALESGAIDAYFGDQAILFHMLVANDKTDDLTISDNTLTIEKQALGLPLGDSAYRLAVDDAPYIKAIRSQVVTLITPVVEVDGRERMVDLYRWHKANPDKQYSRLVYWGHYVAHDNNRDAMALTLNLSRNVLGTYLGWHAQVLHDLHESVPFLYTFSGQAPQNPSLGYISLTASPPASTAIGFPTSRKLLPNDLPPPLLTPPG